ncbi:MAG TPA: hypothetical protein VE591_05075 [Candidatus Acidoferrum sp.]|nr:hypothetical protein [Candidatus Acidoferrum sp.]
MSAIVHTCNDIRELLRRGLTPITDNPEALIELGFTRAFPEHERDFESTIWERRVDVGQRTQDGVKQLVRERAFLYTHDAVRRRARRPRVLRPAAEPAA